MSKTFADHIKESIEILKRLDHNCIDQIVDILSQIRTKKAIFF